MQLSDYLRVPYLLEARLAETIARRLDQPPGVSGIAGLPGGIPGAWKARSGSSNGSGSSRSVRMLDGGEVPPVPRPPLESSDPVWIAEQSDVPADILARIRRNETMATRPA